MRILAGVLVVAILGAGAALWYIEPWGGGDEDTVEVTELSDGFSQEFSGSACKRMAGLAAKIAEKEDSATAFLRAFGRQAAGIRPPPRAYGDLARGGRNLIPGRGFLVRFDDGSTGQVRHFAGIAVASTFGGGAATRFLSIFVRDDPQRSPDGQLTEEGLAFADEVLDGDLALDETPSWLLQHLCRRK